MCRLQIPLTAFRCNNLEVFRLDSLQSIRVIYFSPLLTLNALPRQWVALETSNIQSQRSRMWTSVSPFFLMSLLMVSMYLNFGLPLGLTPSTTMFSTVLGVWLSSQRLTCPYQRSRLCISCVAIRLIHDMFNVGSSCPDVTPPPYTAIAEEHDTSERKEIPSTDGVEAGDTSPVQTVFPRYDVIPADCVAVPEATGVTPEADELPVKAALR